MTDKIITAIFSSGGTLLLVFYLLLKHPNEVKKWVGNLAWVLSFFYKRFQYSAIKNELEGRINSFVGDLSAHTTIDFPTVSIKWAGKDEKEEIIFDDFEAFIVMHDRQYRSRNFVHAAYFFVAETLLRKTKNHLSKNLKKSLDLYATKNILEKESTASLEQFINDYLNPEVEKSTEIKSFLRQFNSINRLGLFFPILIQELTTLGNKTLLSENNQDTVTEVKQLIDFLEKWANRKVGEDIPEAFFGNYVRCSIKVVATKYTREAGKVIPQRDRILLDCKRGCENIYIVGSAKKDSRKFMDSVAGEVIKSNNDVQLLRRLKFAAEVFVRDERKPVVDHFIHLHNPKAVKHLYE